MPRGLCRGWALWKLRNGAGADLGANPAGRSALTSDRPCRSRRPARCPVSSSARARRPSAAQPPAGCGDEAPDTGRVAAGRSASDRAWAAARPTGRPPGSLDPLGVPEPPHQLGLDGAGVGEGARAWRDLGFSRVYHLTSSVVDPSECSETTGRRLGPEAGWQSVECGLAFPGSGDAAGACHALSRSRWQRGRPHWCSRTASCSVLRGDGLAIGDGAERAEPLAPGPVRH